MVATGRTAGRGDGVWLTSSVRGIAEIHELDGVELPVSPYQERLRDLLGYRSRRAAAGLGTPPGWTALLGHSVTVSRADRCGWSGWPTAAMSWAYISAPSTIP